MNIFKKLQKQFNSPQRKELPSFADGTILRYKIRFEGIVQCVGFRYEVYQIATQLKLTGWVRNEMDGSVSIEAEADEKILYIFLNRIKSSPSPFGKVNKMDYTFSDDLQHYTKFTVIG